MIELQHIFKEYRNDDVATKVLNDISLTITHGEFVALMGPSGSGKSTLMNIIGFLDTMTTGTYRFKGTDVSTLNDDQLAQYRSVEVGFVFQAFNLLPKTTVLQNVELPLIYNPLRKSEKERRTRAREAIESVGLAHRADYFTNQLSGGEKQRVAIARALVNNPSIILADEPTGNLDSVSGLQILSILQKLNNDGRTVVLITHEKITAEHARRVVYLKDGALQSDTIVNEQRRASSNETLK